MGSSNPPPILVILINLDGVYEFDDGHNLLIGRPCHIRYLARHIIRTSCTIGRHRILLIGFEEEKIAWSEGATLGIGWLARLACCQGALA